MWTFITPFFYSFYFRASLHFEIFKWQRCRALKMMMWLQVAGSDGTSTSETSRFLTSMLRLHRTSELLVFDGSKVNVFRFSFAATFYEAGRSPVAWPPSPGPIIKNIYSQLGRRTSCEVLTETSNQHSATCTYYWWNLDIRNIEVSFSIHRWHRLLTIFDVRGPLTSRFCFRGSITSGRNLDNSIINAHAVLSAQTTLIWSF